MTDLTQISLDDITSAHQHLQTEYQAFQARGLKLDLTRGKPSAAQLDLSNGLLSLPGADDYLAEGPVDTRNYGGLQGLVEVRRLFSGMMGAAPEQVVAALLDVSSKRLTNKELDRMAEMIEKAKKEGR